jgi:hypothetical protein
VDSLLYRCDHHGPGEYCRNKGRGLLGPIFPNYPKDYIDNEYLILLEEVIEGSVSESDLPNAGSYRELVGAQPGGRFENMLREASRCSTGARNRPSDQSQATCMS